MQGRAAMYRIKPFVLHVRMTELGAKILKDNATDRRVSIGDYLEHLVRQDAGLPTDPNWRPHDGDTP